ncbi:MAG: hypothetical protein V5A38_02070 [Halolamina sp.]|uniref:hypothetical protein n=1 Tax=Halolamina sp. TaxID=1940283 RepID=UPI002FC2A2DF
MSSEESDAGYVHTPESAAEDGVNAETDVQADTGSGDDYKGTVLLATVVFGTLVIPGIIYLYPALLADRVPFLMAMLVLPFVPAVLLGVVAVWSMTNQSG